MNNDTIASAIRHNLISVHAIVSDAQDEVISTPCIVSDIHHDTLKRSQDQAVRTFVFYLSPSNHLTLPRLTLGQRYCPRMNLVPDAVSSAPGHLSPPPPRSTHGTTPGIHRDIARTHTIVSKLEHNGTSTHNMVSDIHRTMVKGKKGGNDNFLVSDMRTVPTTEHVLIPAQTETRSASSTTDGFDTLYLYLAHPVNCLPLPQEPVSVVAS